MREISSRFFTAAVIAAAWAAIGCGSGGDYDAAAKNTPESLAEELAFRYRGLSPAGKKGAKDAKAEARAEALEKSEREIMRTKGLKATPKRAPAETVDDVLDELALKARTIQGVSLAAVFQKMAEAIAEDQSLEAEDRQNLIDRLTKRNQDATR